ncbi:uncharacterized protein A1O9_07027 [Exophiala aquamarina CBS 119918]|uniref:C3H1-type domain-containing protein n=1 Tax=Exophiala aquamarina CBS 119918 TaxID=1182545 RepID=A0A072PAR6_9EURO|nr:uncharacterized protein A1O9_07027 [Exophiala aquamarina CBS 119918]KEF56837.1 hypothetical protein A1O9_07027 [Exophiala aquamarina CBS 119918]
MGSWGDEARGWGHRSGFGNFRRGNSWGGGRRGGSGKDRADRRICRHFQQTGSCRFGSSCEFSHDLPSEGGGSLRESKQPSPRFETSEQRRAKADYNSWKKIIKEEPRTEDTMTMEQLWKGALAILNDGSREWKQRLPRDLDDEQYFGREHIKTLLAMRATFYSRDIFIRIVHPFLLVITHSSMLDCLSVDTSVGGLYNFIGGTNGTRAVPFFQHVCDTLVSTSVDESFLATAAMLGTTLIGVTTTLRELLRREPRTRFNDDLPALADFVENAIQVITGVSQSQMAMIVLGHINEIRAMVARAKGMLLNDGEQEELPSTTTGSSYPRSITMPRDRHDNDKADITRMKIFPTNEEIISDEPDFLPSTDLDQPHFLTDQAERHIDTHFRLLRHDTFGELKNLLGGLMHAVKNDPLNPKFNFGNFRANQYTNALISYVSFDSRPGLEFNISFAQPSLVRKKPTSERQRWWEESKRLSEGTLLSFISIQQGEIRHLFFTVSDKNTDAGKDHGLTKREHQGTITARLANQDEVNVQSAVGLSYQKVRGTLIEYPGILPATFIPILENLQDMQRLSRLPFRQWIIPDKVDNEQAAAKMDITPPLYAQEAGFEFSLEPLLKSNPLFVGGVYISPASLSSQATVIDEMEARTDLDRGQCKGLFAALTREYAFIQGPPGTGKTYLGIQLMKVLMHYQFLEHLLAVGINKIIRIGGQSQSTLLEGHNLRNVSQTETKTANENFLLALQYESLGEETKSIKGDLERIHRVPERESWPRFRHHLQRQYPRIYAQFRQIDEKGYKSVGRHPFERWAAAGHSFEVPLGTGGDKLTMAREPVDGFLLQKAEENVYLLSQEETRKLVRMWTQEIQDYALNDLFERVKRTGDHQQEIKILHDEVDRRALQSADVIGITTTGLAKRISTLKRVRSKVVICEEAGEVMEAHMLSALLPTVEHFIQIGDHEQLRPQINNFINLSLESRQGGLYKLDRSQFERLSVGESGRSKMPVAQLNVQRRMRPEISKLIRETIYPKLGDHPCTIDLPDVVGMRENVFWLDHDHLEQGQHSEMHHKSHSNDWEVEMVHALVRHIVRQGTYKSGDIAVLTPYTGQLQKLRTAMRNDFEIVLSGRDQEALEKDGFTDSISGIVNRPMDSVMEQESDSESERGRKAPLEKKRLSELLRIATVDNFQGEEAKLIIVSLVRSNIERKVGFLRTTNRVNVLLSRAQYGMYLIGNSDTYSNIPMWQKVIDMLRASDAIVQATLPRGMCSMHRTVYMGLRPPRVLHYALFRSM